MTPTLDEQISYLLEEKYRTHLDIARGNAHRVAMFEAVIATLRSVKQAEPDGWVLVRQMLADMKEMRNSVEDWAAYAGDYFREKHRLQQELDGYDQAIRKYEAALAAAPAAPRSPGREG